MGARDTLADLASAGISVSCEGDRLFIRPSASLTDAQRQAIRSEKAQILEILSTQPRPVEWTADDVVRFAWREARLMRMGYSAARADAFAQRLTRRDQDEDDRVVCAVDCVNYSSGRCQRPSTAGLANPLGEFAFMLQRCPAVVRQRATTARDVHPFKA